MLRLTPLSFRHVCATPCLRQRAITRTAPSLATNRKRRSTTKKLLQKVLPHIEEAASRTLGPAARAFPFASSIAAQSKPATTPAVITASAAPLSTEKSLPPLAESSLNLVTPRNLQARLRSLVVQLVLLSPEPLRPSGLYSLYTRVVEEETAQLFQCASRAVGLYTMAEQMGKKETLLDGEALPTHPTEVNTAASRFPAASSHGSTDSVMMDIGKAFVAHYHRSVVSLAAAVQREEQRGSAGAAADVPACCDVVRWMLLHILFSDPELRVSAYGGAVCYPTLPSLLLATSNRFQEPDVARDCYTLQWRQPPSQTSSTARTTTTTTATATSTLMSPHFRWLNGAAGCPPWTLAHAEFVVYDAFVSRRPKPEPTSTTTTAAASVVGAPAMAMMGGLPASSGHRLVDYFLLQSPTTTTRLHRDRAVGKTDAQAFPAAGWNEGTHGSVTAQQYAADLAARDGVLGFHMWRHPTLRQPSGELYHANTHIIFGVMRHLTSVPISVARLSTVLRWNVSMPDAGIYRSFLYLLLSLGANPTIHRMESAVQQRAKASMLCAELLGQHRHRSSSGADSVAAAALKKRRRKRVIKEVRQALEASTGESPSSIATAAADASSIAEPPSGVTEKELRAAFASEADVLRCQPLSDYTVMEVLCLRVLPSARPGAAHVGSPVQQSGASLRGYPLRYVEVLPTWQRTPEEILDDLRAKHLAEMSATVQEARWLETYEEPHVLVCARSTVTVRGRLKAAADAFASIVAKTPMTLRQLGIISLWAHEYGTAMAAEMLFVVLQLNPTEARLVPPDSVQEGGEGGYEAWTVEFL